jgi:purine-binding chemotaxis protein CheW
MNQDGSQYVVFAINRSLYGISIHGVSEIIRMCKVQWIPKSREELLGIIHLRDKVIPVISLHRMFAEQEAELNAKTRIIIVQSGGRELGIVVDAVERVMFLSRDRTSPPPHMSDRAWLTGIYHDGDDIIALLDLEALLGHLAESETVQ